MIPSRLTTVVLTPAILALGILAMAGCGSSATPTPAEAPSSAAASSELAGTAWVLDSYAGPDGTPVPAETTGNVGSLAFDAEGAFTGSTGCNRIAGTYSQDGSVLTMQPGPMTLMACDGPAAAQETALVAALPKVASFTSESTLVLLDAEGAALLTYSPGMTTVEGTSWQATGINNGKDAVVGQEGTEKVTATFGADGALSGSGGCNTYNASYTITGSDQITIGEVASTMMACPEPAMQIEQEYFSALGNVATYQIDGNTLTLRDADGAAQVVFALVP